MSGEQIGFFDNMLEPGTWVETHGAELTFDEIAARAGGLIVMDKSTQSHEWFQVVLVERIIYYEGTRRLVYSDGGRQRGYVDERYFALDRSNRAKAYRLADE